MLSQIPNILSLLRIGLGLLLPFAPQSWWLALIIAGGLTDFLDGWVARRWHLTSWQGALLDGFADKFFMLIALVTVARGGYFSLLWLPPILARDILVLFAALHGLYHRSWETFKRVPARIPGKVTTAGQFLLLAVALVWPGGLLVAFFLALAVAASLLAAFDYGRLFYLEVTAPKG
ncbi:MAG: CDP-alcohol phosphatidyltransferase family protein [Thermodesulfobacteriota bacterium]